MSKITIRIDGIEDEWKNLSKYINGTRSEFIRKCITDKVRRKDKLTELNRVLKEKEFELGLLEDDIAQIKSEMMDLREKQEQNLEDSLLIDDLLDTARKVATNERLTEQRLIAIANDKIDYKILLSRLRNEGYKIFDDKVDDMEVHKSKNGEILNSRIVQNKEKSSFDVMYNILKRNHNSKSRGKDIVQYLEENKEYYEQILGKYDDLDYELFKERVTKLHQ